MQFKIPTPLVQEHEALYSRLVLTTKVPGPVGRVADKLAKLMDPHFTKEELFALPPLVLLPALAGGQFSPERSGVLELTDQLEIDLPSMLAEHQKIFGVLQELLAAGEAAGDTGTCEFAGQLMHHATVEEQVFYPAALLVGHWVKEHMGKT